MLDEPSHWTVLGFHHLDTHVIPCGGEVIQITDGVICHDLGDLACFPLGLFQGGDELLQFAGARLFGQYGQGGEGFLTGDGLEVARAGGIPHLAGLLVELVQNIGQGAQVTGRIGGLDVQGGERVVCGLGGRC
ncbi:hypothetical protein D3C84_721700 [compost metagenome]